MRREIEKQILLGLSRKEDEMGGQEGVWGIGEILVGLWWEELKEMLPLGLEGNIKVGLKEIAWKVIDRNDLA